MKKRIFTSLLALVMVLGMLPVTPTHASEAVGVETTASTYDETTENIELATEGTEIVGETLCWDAAMASSPTYAPYTGVDFMNANISSQRKAALTKAVQMVQILWRCPADFPTWRSSPKNGSKPNTVTAYDDGTKSQKFIAGKWYTGIPYSMADNDAYDDLSWHNALSSGKITTEHMTGVYASYNNGNTTAHGIDCSYFVFRAIKAANAGSIGYKTTSQMLSSSYYTKISWDELLPADIFLKNGHVMMFVGMDGGRYAVFESTADGSKCAYNTYTKSYLTSQGYKCYRYNGFGGGQINHLPQGHVDSVEGGAGTVTVRGWMYDRDDLNAQLEYHVYIGGPAGSGAPGYGGNYANVYRPDVNEHPSHLGVGNYHGFEATIETHLTGEQPVYVYAINVGGGDNPQLDPVMTATITPKESKKIHVSPNTINLVLGEKESEAVYVWTTGSHSSATTLRAYGEKGKVSCSWGEWNANNQVPLTITAKEEGTSQVKLVVEEKSTGTVLDTCYVDVYVSSKTYTVSYNANGGSGAPSSQTKKHGQTLTLSSTKPTRNGYTFVGWSTSSTATLADYAPGYNFTKDANTTLYAVWKADPLGITVSNKSISLTIGETESQTITVTKTGTYTENNGRCTMQAEAADEEIVSLSWGARSGNSAPLTITAQNEGTTVVEVRMIDVDTRECLVSTSVNVTVNAHSYSVTYNANGGSGKPGNQQKNHREELTLSKTVPSRFGYNFAGWATDPSATTAAYQPGDTYSANQDLNLYAVWEAPDALYIINGEENRIADIRYPGVGAYFVVSPIVGIPMFGEPESFSFRVYGTSDADTRVYVYDENGNLLNSDDDSGTGNQFQLDMVFKEPEQYYFYVRFYDTSTTGALSYTIAQGYRITYNANGGEGAPETSFRYHGVGGVLSSVLSSTVPSREGYTFLGWAESADATAAAYQPGEGFAKNENVVLYAVWKDNNIQQGTCGDKLSWNQDNQTGMLTISGSGIMDAFFSESAPWYEFKDQIKTVVIENGVESIGQNAFSDCASVTEITIPESVKTIGANAFSGCSALESITFKGNAPVMDELAFNGITATVYYPANDDTWDAAKEQNLRGNITWVCEECKDGHTTEHGICTRCGENLGLRGDLDNNNSVDDEDVIYLLWHTLMPNDYPVNQNVDYDSNGIVDDEDVIYLLWHTLMPGDYPL